MVLQLISSPPVHRCQDRSSVMMGRAVFRKRWVLQGTRRSRGAGSSRPQGGARSGLRVSTLTEPILMFLALYGLLAKFYYLYY